MNAEEGLDEALTLRGDAVLLVDSLSPTEATRLLTLLGEARTLEGAEVDAAVGAIVSAIPSPLRGRVRTVLQRDAR